MADFDAEELKKLSPERRLKVLKELEEKSRQEIEEARKLMAESEREIEIKEEIERDMPVPQLAAVDVESLFTPEEKELFRTKRFIGQKKEDEQAESREKIKRVLGTDEDDRWAQRRGVLEEVLDKDNFQQHQQEAKQQSQYTEKLESIKDRVYQLQTMAESDPARFMKYESKYKEELEMMKNEWEGLHEKYKTMGDAIAEESSMGKQIDKLLHWYIT